MNYPTTVLFIRTITRTNTLIALQDCRNIVKFRTMGSLSADSPLAVGDRSLSLRMDSRRLLRLLGCTLLTTHILADISRISRLANDTLEGTPSIASSRRCALVRQLSINARSQGVNSLLDEAALRNAGAEEDGVDSEEDP
jgi:hypothetical protein